MIYFILALNIIVTIVSAAFVVFKIEKLIYPDIPMSAIKSATDEVFKEPVAAFKGRVLRHTDEVLYMKEKEADQS